MMTVQVQLRRKKSSKRFNSHIHTPTTHRDSLDSYDEEPDALLEANQQKRHISFLDGACNFERESIVGAQTATPWCGAMPEDLGNRTSFYIKFLFFLRCKDVIRCEKMSTFHLYAYFFIIPKI